jgi:hypothetical protein
MTQDEIIEMAKEAFIKRGFWPNEVMWKCWLDAWILSAQHEREECAKLVQDSWMAFSRAPNSRLDITPLPELEYVAKVIQARGQA